MKKPLIVSREDKWGSFTECHFPEVLHFTPTWARLEKSATQSALIKWKARAWVTYVISEDGSQSQSKALPNHHAPSVFKPGRVCRRRLFCTVTQGKRINDEFWRLPDVNWYGFSAFIGKSEVKLFIDAKNVDRTEHAWLLPPFSRLTFPFPTQPQHR